MKAMFRKLGVQVVVLVIIMLTVSLAAINIISLSILRGFGDRVLTDRAVVGRQVLEESLKEEITTLEHTHRTLVDNNGFMQALQENDSAALDRDVATTFGDSPDHFIVVSDLDGNILYRSSNYRFETYDFGGTDGKAYIAGIVKRDGNLGIISADKVEADGKPHLDQFFSQLFRSCENFYFPWLSRRLLSLFFHIWNVELQSFLIIRFMRTTSLRS